MNTQEYYLNGLMEETAEVVEAFMRLIKRTSKAKRFGLDEIEAGQNLTNRERLQQEVNDILCVLSRLAEAGIIELDGVIPRFNKGKKFEAMLQLSRKLGTLKEE